MADSFPIRLDEAIRSGRGPAEVIVLCLARLRTLASRMLTENPVLRRQCETDDLLQIAAIRLHRALMDVVIESPSHAMGLAVTQLKRELIDLLRSMAVPEEPCADPAVAREQVTHDEALHSWEASHAAVEALPEDQREAVHFLWYLGLDQEDAARLLGTTSRTLRRRWEEAKAVLRARLDPNDFRRDC